MAEYVDGETAHLRLDPVPGYYETSSGSQNSALGAAIFGAKRRHKTRYVCLDLVDPTG